MSPFAGLLNRRYVIALTLAIIVLFVLRDQGPDLETLRDFTHLDGSLMGTWPTQSQFVKQALRDDIYRREYNGTALRKVCSEARWRDGLIVSCDQIAGGIGNLKARLLGCTRYAIEAGAMLVHPAIHPREAFAKMDKSFAWDTDLPLSYMFDSDHYYNTLAEDCPQLRFVNKTSPDVDPDPASRKSRTYTVLGDKMSPAWSVNRVVQQPEQWRPALDKWVRDDIFPAQGLTEFSSQKPIWLSFGEAVQFNWPNAHDGDEFHNDFGHVVRLRQDVRDFSARMLYRMYRRLGCRQRPDAPAENCFLGVHIRTEADAVVENWDTYEVQLAHVREQLAQNRLTALYVATGTASDVERLRADLADLRVAVNETHTASVQVLQKWDLFEDADVMYMDTLTWDQMALVDMDIMLRATRFVGIWESSWGWMIALKRHEWSPEPAPTAHGVTFEDGLSVLYGPQGAQGFIPPTMYL